jgi:hypothetical protein
MVNHEKLAQILVEFSRTLVTEYDVTEMLTQVCERCIEVLPVSGAGVMLEDASGDLRFVAASDGTVREIEGLQIEFEEGPCLQAYRTGESIVISDLQEGGWFGEAHESQVRQVAGAADEGERMAALRTLLAEETRMGMLVGVAVGWELARELESSMRPDKGD